MRCTEVEEEETNEKAKSERGKWQGGIFAYGTSRITSKNSLRTGFPFSKPKKTIALCSLARNGSGRPFPRSRHNTNDTPPNGRVFSWSAGYWKKYEQYLTCVFTYC